MKRLSVPAIMVAALLTLAMARSASADGGGPMRKMTPAEATAFNRVRETIRDALPKTPAGYILQFTADGDGAGGELLPESIQPGQMFAMCYTAKYTRDPKIADQQALSSQIDRAKGTPEQQARLATLNAKATELTQARDATRDRTEKDRIRTELKAVRAETDKVMAEIAAGIQAWIASGAAAQAPQARENSLPAKEISIRVQVNADTHLPDKALPYKVEGIPLAFEQSEGCADFDSYCITALVGSFNPIKKVSGYTGYDLVRTERSSATEARGVVLTFSGPREKPEAVREFVRQTDLAKIRTLLP
jgi:hypothetical protein